jgi:hypothetical protein
MKISEALKKDIHDAVVIALQAYGKDEDVDEQVAAAVIEILEQIPEINTSKLKTANMVKVQYIGHRQEYSDAIAATGNWQKGQVKLIPDTAAAKLLAHPSVYIPAVEEAEAAEEVAEPEEKRPEAENSDTNPDLANARDAVLAMTTPEAVQKFVQDNYNRPIPGTYKRLESMQQYAIQQIDMYSLP